MTEKETLALIETLKANNEELLKQVALLTEQVAYLTKYTKEIKLAIYHEWVDDHRRGTYLSRKYGMGRRGIQYLVDLIQKHNTSITTTT